MAGFPTAPPRDALEPLRPSVNAPVLSPRKTRRGRVFSPWLSDIGPPVQLLDRPSLRELAHEAQAHPDSVLEDPGRSAWRGAAPGSAGPCPAAAPAVPVTPTGFEDAGDPQPPPPALQLFEPPPGKRPSSISKDAYHAKQRSKKRRRVAREQAAQTQQSADAKLKAVARRRRAEATPLVADAPLGKGVDAARAPFYLPSLAPAVAQTSYVACRVAATSRRERATKEELVADGFKYIAWDGRTPTPLIDREGVVFALLAGRPRGEDWEHVVRDATRRLEEARDRCGLGAIKHRRGRYASLTSGISYGGGQTHPINFKPDTLLEQQAIDELLGSASIQRLANFANGAFQLFAPRLHSYYRKNLELLQEKDPALRVNFDNNAFAGCTFNLGPKTVTRVHIDGSNLPCGWCAVAPLGNFDPAKGGHLILWDLRLLIEIPPGSTVLIPSAILLHSNTQIGERESRLSITQYSAGGLFRWVECGFRSRKEYDRIPGAVPLEQPDKARWVQGLHMLSRGEEFYGKSA